MPHEDYTVHWVTGTLLLGAKYVGHEAHHLPPPSNDTKKSGAIPTPPPYHRSNSTFQHNGHVAISGLSEHAVKIIC